MSSANIKVSKKGERRSIPEDVAKLIEIIISEIQSPIDTQKLLENFPPTTLCSKEANQFLKAKDRATRREAFIKTEARWFRKYGWFMARVVTVFGLLVIVFAVIGKKRLLFYNIHFLGSGQLLSSFRHSLNPSLSRQEQKTPAAARTRSSSLSARHHRGRLIGVQEISN
jgi:hypothetical protein